MMDMAITCQHCGKTNRIVEVGTETWESVACSNCKRTMGTLRELALRYSAEQVTNREAS